MNQQEILKKIGGIITELKDQYSYLETSGGQLNELELELFMANANFLSDHIEILRKINGQKVPPALPPAEPEPQPEKIYGQRQQIPDYFSEEEQHDFASEELSDDAVNNFQFKENVEFALPEATETEAPKPEIVQPEPLVEEEQEPILLPEEMPREETEEITVPPVTNDTPFIIQKTEQAEPATEQKSILPEPDLKPQVEAPVQPQISFQPETHLEGASFSIGKSTESVSENQEKTGEKEPVLTLNQRIAAQKNSGSSIEKPQSASKSAAPDLQSLISLNDKLLFVKELFNGYNLAYAEAINILNRYSTFEQAEQFLNVNYSAKNNWKEKPVTVERFYELLHKRFS